MDSAARWRPPPCVADPSYPEAKVEAFDEVARMLANLDIEELWEKATESHPDTRRRAGVLNRRAAEGSPSGVHP